RGGFCPHAFLCICSWIGVHLSTARARCAAPLPHLGLPGRADYLSGGNGLPFDENCLGFAAGDGAYHSTDFGWARWPGTKRVFARAATCQFAVYRARFTSVLHPVATKSEGS